MAQIFPEWSNKVPPLLAAGVVFGLISIIGLTWYYGSPRYTDVGYRPKQPVPYSHKLHAGDLGIDCRYCHTSVEISPIAIIPPTKTCMNCHNIILTDPDDPNSVTLQPIRDSFNNDQPMEWIRVHNLPDFVYFDHSMHLRAGVGCFTCHGNIAEMEVVTQQQPLSMSWCLECHRDPASRLRPLDEITNMKWTAPPDQGVLAAQYIVERNILPPVDCSGCHR